MLSKIEHARKRSTRLTDPKCTSSRPICSIVPAGGAPYLRGAAPCAPGFSTSFPRLSLGSRSRSPTGTYTRCDGLRASAGPRSRAVVTGLTPHLSVRGRCGWGFCGFVGICVLNKAESTHIVASGSDSRARSRCYRSVFAILSFCWPQQCLSPCFCSRSSSPRESEGRRLSPPSTGCLTKDASRSSHSGLPGFCVWSQCSASSCCSLAFMAADVNMLPRRNRRHWWWCSTYPVP